MFNKFRLAFFTLGLGLGIILTNALYTFNPTIEYRDYSKEEIVSLAKDLGMVFLKESIETSPKSTENQVEVREENRGEIILVVEEGDTLAKVAKNLYDLGVIENEEDFQQYGREKRLEKRIRVGTYKLEKNMDYESLIKILTKSS